VSVALGDQDAAVREVAANGLSTMPVEEAMPFVHWLATQLVSRDGELGDRAVVALATSLQGPSGYDERVKLAAVVRPLLQREEEHALGVIAATTPGKETPRGDVAKSLIALDDKNPKVRQGALQSIRDIVVSAGIVSQNMMPVHI